jgi:two-component sensor histidine kinase
MRGWSKRVNWLWRIRPGSAKAYAFATCCVVFASLIRFALEYFSDHVLPFATYYPAVLFASLVGGVEAGTFAAIIGGIFGWWAFLPPQFSFSLRPGDEVNLLVYLFGTLLIVWGADHYRRLMKRLEDEKKFRTLAVEELAHRLKNKIATIQSVISYQLRDNPQTRDAIITRLIAMSAIDDLILATQGRGARIRDVLSAELGPYGVSRISMAGPDILLPPKLVLTMALLVHELATNAAKYGALSIASGHLTIFWSLSGARLSLEWRECGGPIVAAPVRRGFGMRLLSQALGQFGGTAETTFEPKGLVCKLNVTDAGDARIIEPEVTAGRPTSTGPFTDLNRSTVDQNEKTLAMGAELQDRKSRQPSPSLQRCDQHRSLP